jgi:hypothetical protein
VGNIGATTAIITTGNITTINSGLLQNGNSNITVTANGNISLTAAGGATPEVVITSTGVNITGTLNTSSTLTVTGNANVGNLGTAGLIVATGNVTGGNIISVGAILSNGTAGIGYATGAGGTVTQTGSKTATVTLDKICGQITTTADSIGSGTSASFTLTNSTISENDVVYVSIKSGTSVAGAYTIFCDAVANGSCRISVFNLSGSPKTDTLVINYSVIKSVNS